jgi:hypothetical protein
MATRAEKGVFKPSACVLPLPERDDLEVDYVFPALPRPTYLFGVKNETKARLTTISCLEFQKAKLPFKSIAVHEDFEGLGKKDPKRVTSAADKQFVDLEDFKAHAEEYLEREAA